MSLSPVSRDKADLMIRFYVQPRASRDQLVGLHGEAIKVAITAPPVDGKANSHLITFLAKQFRVNKGHVIIEKGETGRHKLVRIQAPQTIPPLVSALL